MLEDQLLARVSDLEATVDQTRNEAQNRRKEVEYLEQQLGVRRDTELVSHRQHRDLKDELESLQTELAAMKTKLEMKAADVDHYRKESHDLQVEVEQMRLELTRARGEKRELCDELERVQRRMGTPFLSTATPMDLSPVPAAYSFSPVSVLLPQIGSDTDDDFVIKSTVRIIKDHLDDDDGDDDDLRRLDLRPRTGSL
ncbi:unnamed protein product [Notodromas monacha]|uniref:Uncharacterized protein n=1 Tax=Notodromas monacha TaxID=399045 RepID=A0A7R9BR07_9CRUS|nr:unnamed protein product [Notodromas monacha]CAG0920102.1 unnamed protein product [Notodromas monacha]